MSYGQQLRAIERQISFFKKGMRWKVNGVDRTDVHISALKMARSNIRKIIDLGYA